MSNILRKAVKLVFADSARATPISRLRKNNHPLKKFTQRELIQLESQIGTTIFGALSPNVVRREFFNFDETTWIWHEETVNNFGRHKSLTTKYEVHPKGILKVQPNSNYKYLEGEELQNFVVAVKEYYERVSRQLYQRDPKTGKKL